MATVTYVPQERFNPRTREGCDEDGTLRTTMAQRTGCTMCGFGIHIENRPHRFDRLRITNYKEWRFWMYDMGWGKVLDYIGVKWEDEYQAPPEQINLDFVFEEDE